MTYSKILTILSIIIFILTIICGTILSIKEYDTSLFSYIISASGGVWGLTMVSYFRKASLENNIKIQLSMMKDIIEMKKQYGENINDYIDSTKIEIENKLSSTINQAIDDSLNPPDIPQF